MVGCRLSLGTCLVMAIIAEMIGIRTAWATPL